MCGVVENGNEADSVTPYTEVLSEHLLGGVGIPIGCVLVGVFWGLLNEGGPGARRLRKVTVLRWGAGCGVVRWSAVW